MRRRPVWVRAVGLTVRVLLWLVTPVYRGALVAGALRRGAARAGARRWKRAKRAAWTIWFETCQRTMRTRARTGKRMRRAMKRVRNTPPKIIAGAVRRLRAWRSGRSAAADDCRRD